MLIKRVVAGALRILPDSIKETLLSLLFDDALSSRTSALHLCLSTEWSLKNLSGNGVHPACTIDCGAYVGNWTRMVKNIFPDTRVLMIEANPERERDLREVASAYPQTVDYAIALLGAREQASTQFHQMGSGSSVFREQSNVPGRAIMLPVRTLDAVVHEKGLQDIDLMKIDVQGAEIEVLKGGLDTLRSTQVIVLETSFLQYNKGAPLVGEVIAFMETQGFVIYDIGTMTRWSTGHILLQADLIFVQRNSPLRPEHFQFPRYLRLSDQVPAQLPRDRIVSQA